MNYCKSAAPPFQAIHLRGPLGVLTSLFRIVFIMFTLIILIPVPLRAFPAPPEISLQSVRLEEAAEGAGAGSKAKLGTEADTGAGAEPTLGTKAILGSKAAPGSDEEHFNLIIEIAIPEGFYQELNSPFFSLTSQGDEESGDPGSRGNQDDLMENITFAGIESDDTRLHKGQKILEGRVVIRASLSGPRALLDRLAGSGGREKADLPFSLGYQLCSFDGNCYYPQFLEVPLTGGAPGAIR